MGDLKFEGRTPAILSLSNSGEIVTDMAGIADEDYHDLPQRVQTAHRIPWIITRALREANKQNVPFDYVLISGGGNDLYPDRVRKILRKESSISSSVPEKYIDASQLDEFIERFGAAYTTLINHIRSQPGYENVKIVTHTYDRITPMPIGAEFMGGLLLFGEYGWFYPILEEYNITDPDHQRQVSTFVLEAMKKKLEDIASDVNYKKNFLVVNTQGVLEHAHQCENPDMPFPVEDYWINEIHPTHKGFTYIAREIHRAIVNDIRKVDKQMPIGNKNCAQWIAEGDSY